MTTSGGGAPANLGSNGHAGAEGELERANERLRELDHRIKNDLQLISSVFVLQLRRLPEGPEREAIRGALERVNGVAAVHRRLDVSGDPARFEASSLVRDLAEEVLAAAHRQDIALRFDLAPVVVPSRQAAPLALITGELVRNALRHAFPDRPGEIEIGFGPQSGRIRLIIRDNGVGLSPHPELAGFGGALVTLLAQQLRGQCQVRDAHPGVLAEVTFPEAA